MLKTLAIAAGLIAALASGAAVAGVDLARLDAVIAARSDADKERDASRHPKETVQFFGLEPGMTVVEVFPGSGWYTRVVAPYIGPRGKYCGANYSLVITEKMMGDRWAGAKAAQEAWVATYPAETKAKLTDAPEICAYRIGSPPADLKAKVDAILFFRALHHLNRFDPANLDVAAAEAFSLVKPGGIVGVEQHRAPETASDAWAIGDAGYIKQSRAIEAFTKAGFVLEVSSEINANPKDQPTEQDVVWRLPPALAGPEETRAARAAIGKSDRMTLLFRKPK